MFPFRLSFSNYRSFVEPVTLPFEKSITFVVGQNNSGKSNVLRFLATLFNKSHNDLDDALDFSGSSKELRVTIDITREYLEQKLKPYRHAMERMGQTTADSIPFSIQIDHEGIRTDIEDDSFIFPIIPQGYFNSNLFINDFRQSGDLRQNLTLLLSKIDVLSEFKGTTYVPNVRFITTAGQEPPMFSSQQLAGSTIAFGKVIEQLAEMDRPSYENRVLKERLRDICQFMEFVLEKRRVDIEVQADRKSIIVSIDDVPRPISSLGTGVEQSLIIGLASFGFPGKLVLIDEPELHLHPRAQKRVITSLNEQSESQFVIATHSAACLDATNADVLHVYEEDGRGKSKLIKSNRERFAAIRNLGHTPSELIQTRFAIWVEGPSDRIYINKWINMHDADLREGIDYSVLFYGGRILSHHGFDDVEADLVKALSLCRSFAVVIDSDRKKTKARINATKARVRREAEEQQGFCWITDGREIENYIPASVIRTLSNEFSGLKSQAARYDQVVNAERTNKVAVARRAAELEWDDWPFDLRKQTGELVRRIHDARY